MQKSLDFGPESCYSKNFMCVFSVFVVLEMITGQQLMMMFTNLFSTVPLGKILTESAIFDLYFPAFVRFVNGSEVDVERKYTSKIIFLR